MVEFNAPKAFPFEILFLIIVNICLRNEKLSLVRVATTSD